MKKIIIYLYIFLFSLFLSPHTFAENKLINREDAFIFFAQYYQDTVPESFQYIDLLYTDIPADSKLEDALQILVYLDLIKNVKSPLFPEKKISIFTLEKFAEKIIQVKISNSQDIEDKKSFNATSSDLEAIYKILEQRKVPKEQTTIIIKQESSSGIFGEKENILQDVYKTLTTSHYDKKDFEENQLVNGAIQGLAAGTGDKYTRYFPPVESGDFFEGLSGEYEGIGAYVDMPAPGNFIIVSPMVGSPAESAGLKGGDRVSHVDGKEITEKNSLKEIVSWIKGPAGTSVELTIIREGETKELLIKVKREKITLKDVEYKKIANTVFYIQIKNFGEHVDTEFQKAIETLKEDTSIKKIIFDLRNNPGGYLGEVSNMLSFFIEKGKATAIVDYEKKEVQYSSLGFDLLNLSDYEVILLQNSGTASASEIMIGTLKDYFPEVTIIGEQSFGKGSVQSLKKYYDGSSLKYTVAKWFTGKTKQGIDGVGITPDIEVKFDSERFKTEEKDNQLERALDY